MMKSSIIQYASLEGLSPLPLTRQVGNWDGQSCITIAENETYTIPPHTIIRSIIIMEPGSTLNLPISSSTCGILNNSNESTINGLRNNAPQTINEFLDSINSSEDATDLAGANDESSNGLRNNAPQTINEFLDSINSSEDATDLAGANDESSQLFADESA